MSIRARGSDELRTPAKKGLVAEIAAGGSLPRWLGGTAKTGPLSFVC